MNAQKETLPFLMQMLQASLTSNEALQLEFNAVNEENRRLQTTVAKLNERLTSLSLDSKKKVDGMMAGFDGIQKRLMLSIDQTRQQAAEPLRILREQNQTLAQQSQLEDPSLQRAGEDRLHSSRDDQEPGTPPRRARRGGLRP